MRSNILLERIFILSKITYNYEGDNKMILASLGFSAILCGGGLYLYCKVGLRGIYYIVIKFFSCFIIVVPLMMYSMQFIDAAKTITLYMQESKTMENETLINLLIPSTPLIILFLVGLIGFICLNLYLHFKFDVNEKQENKKIKKKC